MITPEELMTKFANKHSYETWDELMYDCHPHSQIEYTKRVMLIYARIQVKNLNIPAVMVRSEQLPCSNCGRPMKEHSKDSKLCPDRMKNFEQGN